MQLVNITAEVEAIKPARHTLSYRALEYIIIHRNTVAHSGTGIAQFFEDQYGWSCPYHFFVREDGLVEQLLPLSCRGCGSLGDSAKAVEIAVDWDCRKSAPPMPLVNALVELCSVLTIWKPFLRIEGHSDRPERSKFKNHECPGKFLDCENMVAAATLEARSAVATKLLNNVGVAV